MKIDQNRRIIVFGVSFGGVNEILMYALKNRSKEGVFVGEDSQLYPCFDSSDYAYEHRHFWNFVFAKTQAELEGKLDALKHIKAGGNYNKLTSDFYPMVYWGGDKASPMDVGECGDIVIPNMVPSPKCKNNKTATVRPNKSRMQQLMERLKEDFINKKR